MQIYGFNKTTLLDYPGHVAATVFTGCCNFRCPFCHNGDLVLHSASLPLFDEEEIWNTLRKRTGILTGICITGGEPTLQPDLPAFIRKVKELGYLVKLDTNGYRPDILARLCAETPPDYIAMDIKSSPERYAQVTGMPALDIGKIRESVSLIMGGQIPYEFRTTVVRQLHSAVDFTSIGEWLAGSHAYYLQSYVESDAVLQPGFSAYSRPELEGFLAAVKPYIPNSSLRGID